MASEEGIKKAIFPRGGRNFQKRHFFFIGGDKKTLYFYCLYQALRLTVFYLFTFHIKGWIFQESRSISEGRVNLSQKLSLGRLRA